MRTNAVPVAAVAAVVALASAFALKTAAPGCAEERTAGAVPETIEIPSAILHETRTARVYLPEGYESGTERYPVFYKLDGEWDAPAFARALDGLAREGRIPRMILVAVENTNRRRDMTPTRVDGEPRTGEARYFLSFLRRELIPAVDGRYRTSGERILFGHSLAGLLVTYAFVAETDLFDRWIATSPSIPYDLKRLVFLAGDAFGTDRCAGKSFYFATGTEDLAGYLEAARTLAAFFDANAPAGLRWTFEPLEGENHRTVPSVALGRALLFLYPEPEKARGAP